MGETGRRRHVRSSTRVVLAGEDRSTRDAERATQFPVIKMELSGKTVYGRLLKTMQLSDGGVVQCRERVAVQISVDSRVTEGRREQVSVLNVSGSNDLQHLRMDVVKTGEG